MIDDPTGPRVRQTRPVPAYPMAPPSATKMTRAQRAILVVAMLGMCTIGTGLVVFASFVFLSHRSEPRADGQHMIFFSMDGTNDGRYYSQDGDTSVVVANLKLADIGKHYFSAYGPYGVEVRSDMDFPIERDPETARAKGDYYAPFTTDPRVTFENMSLVCGCGEAHVTSVRPIRGPHRLSLAAEGLYPTMNYEIRGTRVSERGETYRFDAFVLQTKQRADGFWFYEEAFELDAPVSEFDRYYPEMKFVMDSACGIDEPTYVTFCNKQTAWYHKKFPLLLQIK